MKDFVLKLAREAIENYVKTGRKISIPEDFPEKLREKKGVFVTIYKKSPKELRGCIGFPYPEKPLIEGIIEAAIFTCEDPRFEPLKEEELDDILIEVSILTEPELIEVENSKEYLEKIETGKHGLIIKKGFSSGLLLPQVWKQIPRKEDFLEALSMKAGLLADEWLNSSAEIYKFQVEAFEEKL